MGIDMARARPSNGRAIVMRVVPPLRRLEGDLGIALVRVENLLRQLGAGLVGNGEHLVQVGAMASHLRVDGRGRECRSGCRIPH